MMVSGGAEVFLSPWILPDLPGEAGSGEQVGESLCATIHPYAEPSHR
jgi:hypothetical protein